MHAAIQLAACWALAFLTLGLALVLLNIFFGLIGNDLELRSVGTEAAIASVASLIEGGSAWLILSFAPAAARAMIIPAIVVAVIYQMAHLEDWSRSDVFMLLIFQAVIGCFGVTLFFGHFQAAIFILVGFVVVLAVIASFASSL
jgi:hypothetical protein